MKQMKSSGTQRGFFAVGLGLALTAVFGLVGLNMPTGDNEQLAVDQQTEKVQEIVYTSDEN